MSTEYRYRAVGLDHRDGGEHAVRDEGAWTFAFEEVDHDHAIMLDADPRFDEVIVERQQVTYGAIEATRRASASRAPGGDG